MQYRWDEFVLDLDAYRLERAGKPLPLEPKAFNLLALLVTRPGHVFTKQELFDVVWPDVAVTDHALTRVIAQIRRALGDEAREARYVETVPTRGYRWLPSVRQAGPLPVTPPAPVVPSVPSAAAPALPPPAPRRRSWSWTAAGVLAASIMTLGVWVQRQDLSVQARDGVPRPAAEGGADPAVLPWPVQLTTHAGLDRHPTLSPDGDTIAFASDRSGGFEIYVRALQGTATETALTTNGGQNVQPAWSRDGRFLAYHSQRFGGIWVIPARGGTPRQITPAGSNPSWSPDSQRIAFQSDEHVDVAPEGFVAQAGSIIKAVRVDGSEPRDLTRAGDPMGGHAAPSWSADGRYLAFSVFDGAAANGLWLLDLAAGATKALDQGHPFFESTFAPDGSAIYAAGGVALLFKLPFDAATGSLRGPRVPMPMPGVAGVRGMSISADGRRLAFAGLALSSQLWAQPIDRNGSTARPAYPLTNDTSRRNSLPSISPDGSRVAYLSTRRGEQSNVWVMDIDGSHPVQITADETGPIAAGARQRVTWTRTMWLPDGRRVVYLSRKGDQRAVRAVDVGTRRDELLYDTDGLRPQMQDAHLSGALSEVALAPSLTSVAFTLLSPPAGRRTTYVTTLNDFAPRAVTDATQSAGYPSWSPDERRLALELDEPNGIQAAVLDLDTGAVRRLTSERGQTWVRSWSPDGRRIAVAAMREGQWSLRWIDAASTAQGILTRPAPPRVYYRYPEWSPRGDVLLFERGELMGNIWMITLK